MNIDACYGVVVVLSRRWAWGSAKTWSYDYRGTTHETTLAAELNPLQVAFYVGISISRDVNGMRRQAVRVQLWPLTLALVLRDAAKVRLAA